MVKSECGTLERVEKSRTTAQQIDSFNKYLSFGHGRGRVAFEATEYRGKVGYFFIKTSNVNGVLRECLCFSDGMGTQGDIELLPFSPSFERVSIAKMKNVFGQFKREKIARQNSRAAIATTQIEEFQIKFEAVKLKGQDLSARIGAVRKKILRLNAKLAAAAIKEDCPRFSGILKDVRLQAKAITTGNSDGDQFTNSFRMARNIVAMMCDKKGTDMANRQTTIT